jgi:hypothetical protein
MMDVIQNCCKILPCAANQVILSRVPELNSHYQQEQSEIFFLTNDALKPHSLPGKELLETK